MDEKRAQKVRRIAMALYGHKKGALSAAINTAINDWLAKFSKIQKPKENLASWSSLRGALSEVTLSSVELQHATTKSRTPK